MRSSTLPAKGRKTPSAECAGGGVIRSPGGKKRSVSINVALVARRQRMRFDRRAEQCGITRAQWSVLSVVGRRPGVTQRTVADVLLVSDVTAGRMIDRLCAEGYLERRENPEDRRAYRVYLTDAAGPVMQKLNRLGTQFEDELFADFTDAEIATLDRLLGVLVAKLGEPGSDGDA